MTIDERIEKLVERQEAVAEDQRRTQVMLADIVDSIKRLERIALAHTLDIDDVQRRLDKLETRRKKKPQ